MKCPICKSEEIDSLTPRTVYACGSSDYDQRPGTFIQSNECKHNLEYLLQTGEITLEQYLKYGNK